MSATVITLDPSRFSSADLRLMERVIQRLGDLGFAVARETGDGYDSFILYSANSGFASDEDLALPAWLIVRNKRGRYELQDGFCGVVYRGGRLDHVLLPGWLPERQQAERRFDHSRHLAVEVS